MCVSCARSLSLFAPPHLLQAPAVSAFPIGGELATSLPTPCAGTEFKAFDADGNVEVLHLVAPDAITRNGMFRKGKRDRTAR